MMAIELRMCFDFGSYSNKEVILVIVIIKLYE
jgi:hypothetical protein